MGIFLNIRLVVIGKHVDVLRFSKRTPANRASATFDEYMFFGESVDLSAERVERLSKSLSRKVYRLQLNGSDGSEKFLPVSIKNPDLTFIVVHGYGDECGSYFMQQGRKRYYRLPESRWNRIMVQHGYNFDGPQDPDFDHTDNDMIEDCYATPDGMDICQDHWEREILGKVSGSQRGSRLSKKELTKRVFAELALFDRNTKIVAKKSAKAFETMESKKWRQKK